MSRQVLPSQFLARWRPRLGVDFRAELSAEVPAEVPLPWDFRELGMTRTSNSTSGARPFAIWNVIVWSLERSVRFEWN